MKKGLLLAALFLVSTSAFAQQQFQASAKFVCGRPEAQQIEMFAFAPGLYYSSINVTNPHDQSPINGRKRFSIALQDQRPGPFTPYFPWALAPGQSMQVDCGDIYRHLGLAPGTFIDGFVHIYGAPVRFDATAVYTVSNGTGVVSQDVEEVTVR